MGRVVTAAAIAIAVTAASLAAAARASQAPRAGVGARAVCARGIDQMTAPTLRDCGYRVDVLRRVTALPAGGRAYDYGDYTLLVPPAHFSPLRESDRVLAAYGFPTRKRIGKAWYRLMRAVRSSIKPPQYLVEDPKVHYNTTSAGWAGYDVNDHQYLSVETTWTEPHFVGAGCSGDQFAEWAGIGGLKSSQDLGQEGTTFNHPNWPAHTGFIETISGGSGDPVEATNFDPAAGDSVYALVSWNASTSEFDYYMEDVTTGVPYSAHSRVVSANLATAEVVSERPVVGYTQQLPHVPIYADLSDFQSLRVRYAKAYWSGSSSGFYGDSHNSLTMVDNASKVLTQPGTIGSGSGFTDTWEACD